MSLECGGLDAAVDCRSLQEWGKVRILAHERQKNISFFSLASKLRSLTPALSHREREVGAFPIAFAFLVLLFTTAVHAQQPFYTDDADVTQKRKFHIQISNELDVLQRTAYPSLRQNTTVFEIDYGLGANVEIGVDWPLIAIRNSRIVRSRNIVGFGDFDLHVKYNFLQEREGSRRPALAATFAVELPTGDARNQLGSGLTDYSLNGILQKSLTKKTKLRLNGGLLFAGSTATGDVGIKTRGRVFVTGGSLVKQFTPKFDLGFEVVGAIERGSRLSAGQIQTQVGGNYQFSPHASFDFGILAGKYNSPRAGLQLGISIDF